MRHCLVSRTIVRLLVMGSLVAVLMWSTTPAMAQLNLAVGKPIIDGSGSWDGGAVGVGAPFDGGQFPASSAVDGLKSEPDGGTPNWWLGREQTPEEYFTLDLGDAFEIDRIDLYNTHNRQFNDRGTDEFVILGATEVDGDNQLVNPTAILSGNLSDVSFEVDIPADSYTDANGLNVTTSRYLQFQTFSSIYANGNVGLNEIEVYSSSFVSPNRALNKPVIDGSGAWDGNVVGEGAPFDGGQFPATTVTDGSIADGDATIWLGREGVPNEYFTLDLEAPIDIQEILLRNTTNREFADRGTMSFRILASSEVNGANELVDPVEILTGKLPNSAGLSPVLETVFTADNGLVAGQARYLRFETMDGTYFNDNVGLNEIEVYDEVLHEPTPPPRDNLALGKPVIDGSGSWAGGDPGIGAEFDGGDFPATRVTDGSVADEHSDGGSRTSYWLGREQTEEEFFTLDLEEAVRIEEIVLRNTHNDQFNDRGTDEFVLVGALEVDGNNQLVDPFPIVSGNLDPVDGEVPIEGQTFNSDNGLQVADARYLQFLALNYFGVSSGLNEIEVYGQAGDVMPGDYNADGVLDALDIDLQSAEMKKDPADQDLAKFDHNNDGVIDVGTPEAPGDRLIWVKDLRMTSVGDSNFDDVFDSGDLVLVFGEGKYDTGEMAGWAQGDWSGDMVFDSGDLVLAFQDGGYVAAAVALVPEPASLVLLLIAIAGLTRFVRRQR